MKQYHGSYKYFIPFKECLEYMNIALLFIPLVGLLIAVIICNLYGMELWHL
jgi:hypothetical protein